MHNRERESALFRVGIGVKWGYAVCLLTIVYTPMAYAFSGSLAYRTGAQSTHSTELTQ